MFVANNVFIVRTTITQALFICIDLNVAHKRLLAFGQAFSTSRFKERVSKSRRLCGHVNKVQFRVYQLCSFEQMLLPTSCLTLDLWNQFHRLHLVPAQCYSNTLTLDVNAVTMGRYNIED